MVKFTFVQCIRSRETQCTIQSTTLRLDTALTINGRSCKQWSYSNNYPIPYLRHCCRAHRQVLAHAKVPKRFYMHTYTRARTPLFSARTVSAASVELGAKKLFAHDGFWDATIQFVFTVHTMCCLLNRYCGSQWVNYLVWDIGNVLRASPKSPLAIFLGGGRRGEGG